MIKSSLRIPRQFIPYILKKGSENHGALFITRQLKNNEQFSRYRVIISKKISTSAVKRNRLRRQIYEAIRLIAKESVEKGEHYDIIFIPKKKILDANYQQIWSNLKKSLQM